MLAGSGDGRPLFARRQHQHRCLAIVQDVADAAGGIDRMHRHRHQATRQAGLIDTYRIDRIGQEHGNARAMLQLQGINRCRPGRDTHADFLPWMADPFAARSIELAIRFPLRRRRDAMRKKLAQCLDVFEDAAC